MTQHHMKFLTILIISLLSFTAVAAADDPGSPVSPPHQFYGTLEVNGQPAPDGTIIEAYMGGALPEVSDSNGFTATQDGVFGSSPYYFIVSGEEADSSDATIRFYLSGDDGDYYLLGTHAFERYETSELDFSIDCATCVDSPAQPAETNDGGGSGSGSSSSGSIGTSTTSGSDDDTENSGSEVCVPDWKCSSWTVCSNGNQERVCIDRNDCGTEESMPDLTASCEMPGSEGSDDSEDVVEQSATPAGFGDRLTGMVTGASGLGALVFLAAIALIVLFVVRRKK